MSNVTRCGAGLVCAVILLLGCAGRSGKPTVARGDFPGIRDSHLLRSDVKARHDKMVNLVETMLKLHKDLPNAKTPHEQESLQRQIAATDKQIDALVYELYGLMDDETQIVERAG